MGSGVSDPTSYASAASTNSLNILSSLGVNLNFTLYLVAPAAEGDEEADELEDGGIS
jgi:hypothetical protein